MKEVSLNEVGRNTYSARQCQIAVGSAFEQLDKKGHGDMFKRCFVMV